MFGRRSFFRLALCAVAASAMEVCGWEGVKPFDPLAYKGEVRWVNILTDIWEDRCRVEYQKALGNLILYGQATILMDEKGYIKCENPLIPENPIETGIGPPLSILRGVSSEPLAVHPLHENASQASY